jgi:hypothetical protein
MHRYSDIEGGSMPREDDATTAARQDTLAELERQLTDPSDHGPVRLGGPVVAGPPDDALHAARLEIMAALNGDPTPGGV